MIQRFAEDPRQEVSLLPVLESINWRGCKYTCSEDLSLSSLVQNVVWFCCACLLGSNDHSGHMV